MSTLWVTVCLGSVLPLAKVPDLKPLVDFAVRHRLPLPPRDAPLVFAHTQWRQGNKGIYTPALLLDQRPDGSIVILRGLDRETLKPRGFHKGERLWQEFTFTRADDMSGEYLIDVPVVPTFCNALQLATRGDLDTARRLLAWIALCHLKDDHDLFKDPLLFLAREYADHLEHRLLQGPANWRDVRARMQALFDDFPDLNFGQRKVLFADLAATLDAKPAPAGSVEALLLDWAGRPTGSIDSELPDWAARPGEPVGVPWLFHPNFPGEGNTPAREIVLRGFDAVPDLLALLDDRRVTAHDAGIGDIARVGDLAGELLQEIAGIPPETGPQTDRPARRPPAYWGEWWEKMRGVKERDYYTRWVFRTNWVGRVTGVNPAAAQIIARKYPDLLPGLCAEFSKRAGPAADPSGLADAVAVAPRSKEKRVEILAAFAGRGPPNRRLGLAETVARVDVEAGTQLLLPLLARMPRESGGPYPEYSETVAAWVVAQVPDERVWKECLRIARRADVGLRLEMIDRMMEAPGGKPNRERLLAFLAAFLDDVTVRDVRAVPKKYGDLYAAHGFETIAVRDFAAMVLADLLGLDDEPDRTWDAIQWAKLRNAVRRKLAGEQLPDLGPAGGKN